MPTQASFSFNSPMLPNASCFLYLFRTLKTWEPFTVMPYVAYFYMSSPKYYSFMPISSRLASRQFLISLLFVSSHITCSTDEGPLGDFPSFKWKWLMSDFILLLWNGIGPNKGTSAYLIACFLYLYLPSNLKNPKNLLCCWENLAHVADSFPCNKFGIRANFWGTLHMSEFFFVCSFRKETRAPNPLNLFYLGLLPSLTREVIITWSILEKHRKIGSKEKGNSYLFYTKEN